MANEVMVKAWATKLGSSPAKQVLVLLADHGNTDGYGWPSFDRILELTELKERTLRRILQVFGEIGLVQKVTVPGKLYGRAFQINIGLLGRDLTTEFRDGYELARRRVSETPSFQTAPRAETAPRAGEGAAPGAEETAPGAASAAPGAVPPHPLIGVTTKEPLRTPPPSARLFPDAPGAGNENAQLPESGRTRAIPDTPWHQIIHALAVEYEKATRSPLELTGQAAGKLKREMGARPRWGPEDWIRCIHNRFASKNVNLGESPERFIPKLKDFSAGPINRFGSNGGDDAANDRRATRSERNRAALEQVHREIDELDQRGAFEALDRAGFGDG